MKVKEKIKVWRGEWRMRIDGRKEEGRGGREEGKVRRKEK